MSAVGALLSEQGPVLKPAQAMTHPLQGIGTTGRVNRGEPFDPEELSRRLQAYLGGQKLRAERRGDARAARVSGFAQQSGVYRHVPKVAATAFERTTTTTKSTNDIMRKVHKLAKPALKLHLEPLHLGEPHPDHLVTSLQRTKAFDQALIERDILRARNQFQWSRDMEEAREADLERDVYKLPRRTFNPAFLHLRGSNTRATHWPLSTGEMFREEVQIYTKAKPKGPPVRDANDRTDWAQRDQNEVENTGAAREQVGASLRKRDSIWILKGKEKSPQHDKHEPVIPSGNIGSSSGGNKIGRRSFLARLKRYPSRFGPHEPHL